MNRQFDEFDRQAEQEGIAERKQFMFSSHTRGFDRGFMTQGFDVRSGKRGRRIATIYNNAVRANDIRLSYGRCEFDKLQGIKHSRKNVKKILQGVVNDQQEEKTFCLHPVDL